MIKFIGEYTGKIDDKGRVVFPSVFKSLMAKEGDMRLVIRKDTFEPCLEVYTYSEWERRSEQLMSRLDFLNKKHAAFWRFYMHNRTEVEPDAKLGRINIPNKLLEAIGASKEVIFAGKDHKIEIWAGDRYDSGIISEEEFVSIAAQISDSGQRR